MTGEYSAHATGCLVCGEELVYPGKVEAVPCSYCDSTGLTEVTCRNGHLVCDRCHTLPANDFIELHCARTNEPDPLAMAMAIMRNPALKMHGPEHHFLVAAVLITAWCIEREDRDRAPGLLAKARIRAEDVKGGFCGTHGACGAAIGAGIAFSIITGATPLSAQEWRSANLMTATCLAAVAETGGPRCCKLDTLVSIMSAVKFLNASAGAFLPSSGQPTCEVSHLNRECLGVECPFYRDDGMPR